MPVPSPLETVTVRGVWVNPISGTPLSGTAILRAASEAKSPAGDVLLTTSPERRSLVAGAAEWTGVVFTDSTGLTTPVLYQLEVFGSGFHDKRYVELRKANAVGGVIQLADVAVLETAPATVQYVLASSVGQVGGPAGPLDADRKIPADQLPAGGGGGAVASVDGRTGVVTLSDLYIDPTELATGLAGKANTSHTHTASQVTDLTSAVDARVQLIVDAAPAALDTLNELAAALGDDPNFAATVTTALAVKAPLNSPAFTGTPTGITQAHVGLANVDDTADLAKPISTAVQAALDGKATVGHQHAFDSLLGGYAFVGATGWPSTFGGSATPGQADHLIGIVAAPPGAPVAGVKVALQAGGTYSATGVPAQVKVYDFTGALLGSSPDDASAWLTPGWRTATLTAPITVPADGLLYVGISFGGFTGVQPAVPTGGQHNNIVAGLAGGKRQSIFASSGSGLPASFDPVTYGSTTVWYPLMGVFAP